MEKTSKANKENAKRALQVGRIAKLFDAGYTTSEIATALNMPESTVRKWVSDIQEVRHLLHDET